MKSKFFSPFFILFILLFIFFIFRNWFSRLPLSGFDVPFFYPARLAEFTWQRFSWSSLANDGLGGNTLNSINIDTYLQWGVKVLVETLKIPWNLVVRILFFWPFLIVGFFSSFLFCKNFIKNNTYALLGALIYLTNTYILMLVSGGQMGVALAYAFCPFVLTSFVQKRLFFFTLSLVLLVLFDLRLTFLTFGMIILWLMIVDKNRLEYLKILFLGTLITLGLHSFWLLPIVSSSSLSLPEGYGSSGWLNFLSVATFSNSFSFLHPNWPENIFGKTYFMRPEFLFLPLLAYGSLLFYRNSNPKILNFKQIPNSKLQTPNNATIEQFSNKTILYFALLGLLGAFLAKGVNPPLGEIYAWLFSYLPVFSAFRDPTKFYLLIALSYSVLIPFSLLSFFAWLRNKLYGKRKALIPILVVLFFLSFWIVLLIPVFNGRVGGTLRPIVVPKEYYNFEKLISSEPDFSRILVVPWRNRFIFSSENHPALDASRVFKTTELEEIEERLQNPETIKLLENLAVRYVVIPDDFTQEIFLTHRKYDHPLRLHIEQSLDKSPFLHKVPGFNGLSVYLTTSYQNHFFVFPESEIVKFIKDNPIKYTVFLQDVNTPLTLVFSEKYDPNWQLWDGTKILSSQKTKDNLNSFILDKTGTYEVTVYYTVQNLLQKGDYLSFSTLLLLAILMGLKIAKRKKISPIKFLIFISIIISIMMLIFWIIIHNKFSDGEKITDKNIWWSKEWQKESNPLDKSLSFIASYGGSELRFQILGGYALKFKMSGQDKSRGTGIEMSVDGNKLFLLDNQELEKEISLSLNKNTHLVRLRVFCSGHPGCFVKVKSIKLIGVGKIIPIKKLPSMTLAVLGDSISAIYGVDNYTFQLTDRLEVLLHNSSLNGSTLTAEKGYYPARERFKRDIVRYQPDMVLLAIGTNDVTNNISKDLFKDEYEKLVSQLKQELPSVKLYIIGLMRRFDEKEEIAIIFNQELQQISAKFAAKYIDVFNSLNENDFLDSLHPSWQAQKKITDTVANSIEGFE